MANSNTLIALIKEVIKYEVKRQVDKKLLEMSKSGIISFNKQNAKPNVTESSKLNKTSDKVNPSKVKQTYSKNPVLNEILNTTTPFSVQHKSEGGGSVLDMINREVEQDWGTINMSSNNLHVQPTPQSIAESTGNESVDLVAKALSRDYTELVKRFK